MFIYFWESERQSARWRGAEREGGTESGAGSRLWAVNTEPDAGFELSNCKIMTWAEVRCLTDWATQVPHNVFYLFLRERDTECQPGRGRERERKRHGIWSRLQALSCQHRAQHGTWTHKLQDHDLSWSWMLNRLSHLGASATSILMSSSLFCLLEVYFSFSS